MTSTVSIPHDALTRYAFCDPASGRTQVKRVRSRAAVVVIAADHLNRIFVLFAWSGRVPTSKLYDKILSVASDYRPKLFGIEANAMQSLFADGVRMESRHRDISVAFVPVLQPTRIEKEFRIRTALEPAINTGRLFIQEHHHELLSELRGFPTAATKDLVDALASAVMLVPKRAAPQRVADDLAGLASYLRSTGAPGWYIEKRMREGREHEYGKSDIRRP